tara:strand:- start:2337 stop:3053 length:717 start_codon:yes stop_codon:yes gene_type:complete
MAAYEAYTLGDLQTQLAQRADGSPFWTSDESTDAINEALLMWNALTGFWKDTVEVLTTPNNWDYQLSASLVFGSRVEFNNKPLVQASLGDMDYGHPGWQGQTTADGGSVPNTPRNWLPLSIDMIAIWPADAAGSNILKIDGVSATPQLNYIDDYINIGAEELSAILGYALHVMALKEGGARFEGTKGYLQDFLKAAAEENDQLTMSSAFRNFIGTDMNRQTRPVSNNTAVKQFNQDQS